MCKTWRRLLCDSFALFSFCFLKSNCFQGTEEGNEEARKEGRQAGKQEEWRQGGQEEGKTWAFRCLHVCVLSRIWLFETPLDFTPWLLCPWESPGKNTGGGCHALLQGTFPTQGSHLRLSCIGKRVLYRWVRSLSIFLTNSFGKLLMGQVIGRKEGQEGERRKPGRDQNRLFTSGRKHASGSVQALGTRPLPFSPYRKRPAKMRNYHRRAGY